MLDALKSALSAVQSGFASVEDMAVKHKSLLDAVVAHVQEMERRKSADEVVAQIHSLLDQLKAS